MSKKNGSRYSIEFKKQIVDLYYTGKPVTELSREYDVSTVSVYKWIDTLTPIAEDKTLKIQKQQALKKRIIELETENEILRKATLILAKKQ